MKRSLWTSPILFIALSVSAFANSTTIFLSPNDGSGDNFGFVQGHDVLIDGGVPFDFFNIFGFAPGSTFGGGTDVFFSDGFIQIGNATYNLDFNSPGTLFVSSFTFPTNGQSFTIQAFASFSVTATIFVNGQPKQISLAGSAPGLMSFVFDPSSGLFFGSSVVFTANSAAPPTAPEPGTLGLMGTGLIGVLGAIRRKLRIKRAACA